MAMLFGYKEGDLSREKQPSFLVLDESSEHAPFHSRKRPFKFESVRTLKQIGKQ